MATIYTFVEKNVRRTWILLLSFLIFIIFLGWFFSKIFQNQAILYFAILFSFLMNFLSFWYSDKIVLKITGAKPLKKEENPEIYRIVENLCIASGLPMPKIYIIEERQPNAFATGRDEKHSAIAFTRGLLESLEKKEIEGVAAHELSHIKNKDILLQSIVVVLVGFVVLLCDWFLRLSLFFGRDEENSRSNIFFFISAIILAILAPILAQIIQFAISRKREFLADASAALLTRYPEGLASALEKISRYPYSMKGASNATAHLFITSPFRGKTALNWIAKLFSTHPPVEERIKALREMAL